MCEFLVTFISQDNYFCGNPGTAMSSANLNDAKQECQYNSSCHKFYDDCANGNTFHFCKDRADPIPSRCGSILYEPSNTKAYRRIYHPSNIF